MKLTSPSTSTASFDVFDTLLTRLTGSPESVFRALGARALQEGLFRGTAEGFARMRVLAEQRAIGNSSPAALTLERIHEELAASLLLSPGELRRLMALECALEAELLREVPGARKRVAAARRAGQRIVFISDMYLPGEFIREQLARFGIWQPGDGVYVSCEHGKCKSSGNLFRHALAREAVKPTEVCHEGNHAGVDVRSARRCGLQARMFAEGNLNRYEEILERHAAATEGLTSLFAGASRLARLSAVTRTAGERALVEAAAGVVGPLLTGFVLWTLNRAERLGIRRLYFVSRDGQILLKIARKLQQRLGFSCELRYLYGSRDAWCLPPETGLDPALIEWALPEGEFPSASTVLFRIGVSPRQVEQSLEGIGLRSGTWDRPLTPEQHRALRALMAAPDFQQEVAATAREKAPALLGYLRQEGLFDEIPWAMVDVGWRGTMQYFLRRTLQAHGGPVPLGLYCGICKSGSDADTGPREAYVADERSGCGFTHLLYRLARPFEVFCSADHGTVIGYREAAGRYQPVLEPREEALLGWNFALIQQTVECFAEQLPLEADWVNPRADVRHATLEALETFWAAPTPEEATAWGAFFYEENRLGATQRYQLAGSYSWKHVAAALCSGQVQRLKRHDFSWHEGSVALSPLPIRLVIQQATQAAVLARRLGSRACRVLRPARRSTA